MALPATDATTNSVLPWCNALRARMAPETFLASLNNYVDYSGHQFLEDQLKKLLGGSSSELTLVEFAKTPGRRKDVFNTARAPLASAMRPKLVDANKENPQQQSNTPVVNAFTQKLLQARDEYDASSPTRAPLRPVLNSPRRPVGSDELFAPHAPQATKLKQELTPTSFPAQQLLNTAAVPVMVEDKALTAASASASIRIDTSSATFQRLQPALASIIQSPGVASAQDRRVAIPTSSATLSIGQQAPTMIARAQEFAPMLIKRDQSSLVSAVEKPVSGKFPSREPTLVASPVIAAPALAGVFVDDSPTIGKSLPARQSASLSSFPKLSHPILPSEERIAGHRPLLPEVSASGSSSARLETTPTVLGPPEPALATPAAMLPAKIESADALSDTDNTTRLFGASVNSAGSDNTTRLLPKDQNGRPIMPGPSPYRKREPSIQQHHGGGIRPSWLRGKSMAAVPKKRKSDEREDDDLEDKPERKKNRVAEPESALPELKANKVELPEQSRADMRASLLRKTSNQALFGKSRSAAAEAAIAAARARIAERGPDAEPESVSSLTSAAPSASIITPAGSIQPVSRHSWEQDKDRRFSLSEIAPRLERVAREQRDHGSTASMDDSMSTTPPDSPPPPPRSQSVQQQQQQQRQQQKDQPQQQQLQSKQSLLERPILFRPHVQQQQQASQRPVAATKLQPELLPRLMPKLVPPPVAAQLPMAAPAPFPTSWMMPSLSPSALRKGIPGAMLLSAQSSKSSVIESIFDSASQSQSTAQGTQDTEWMGGQPLDGTSASKPFDARMVPDETRYWDKTPQRVPGGWDGSGGAMEIDDEDEEDDEDVQHMIVEHVSQEDRSWSDDEEDQLDEASVHEHWQPPSASPQATTLEPAAKKPGLFSSIYRALGAVGSTTSPRVDTEVSNMLPPGLSPSLVKLQPHAAGTPEPKQFKESFVPKRQESKLDPASKLAKSRLERAESEQPQGQPQVTLYKSQQAAHAAKKAELEKQTRSQAIKDNMEARRLANAQRKKEDEELRAAETERKQREEMEKRKREREAEEKRVRPVPGLKKVPSDDESNKKRKLEPVAVKKPPVNASQAVKKPGDSRPPSRIGKPGLGASTSAQPGSSMLGKPVQPLKQAATAPASTVKLVAQPAPPIDLPAPHPFVPQAQGQPQPMPPPSMLPTKNKFVSSVNQGPARSLQEQMQARVQAQIDAANGEPNPDDIELPEIRSEYSDSDDEDRKDKKADLPEWAQSPNLRRHLKEQLMTDPDEVFGAIREIDLDDIFKSNDKSRMAKFRARSSSANWAKDGLSVEEKQRFASHMYSKTVMANQAESAS